VDQWIGKAEHDLTTARHTLTLKEECPFDTICFHSQQCAEKYLKALLIFHGIDFAKIHDLTELAALVPEAASLNVDAVVFQELNPYAVEMRYPGLSEMPTREEAMRAVDLAGRIRQAVRDQLSVPT
jgi:HEPN domain-containing protein